MGFSESTGERPLRQGDVVEVRPAAEILATLDGDAALDKMPFMPEMLRHAGRRYTVTRRVDKICDTIAATGSRRMHATVYLDDLRCDGSAHGGCQAGCKLYWKEAWLRRVDDTSGAAGGGSGAVNGGSVSVNGGSGAVAGEARAADLRILAEGGTRTVREPQADASEVWRCQATEALEASEPLKTSNLSQYWRELRNGNFRLLRFIRLLARAFVMEVADRVGLLKPLPLHGPENPPPPAEPLNLRPGDLVQVRSPAEIEATLDENGCNRGLSFDREMLPYCGQTLRVKDRVERIVDDRTGRMLKISKDCIILDGSVCSGECSAGRWFCPRQIHSYWREAWLRRVEEPSPPESGDAARGSSSQQSMPRI